MSSHIHFKPAYLKLLENDQLQARADEAYRHMADCDLCARYCHVDRYAGIEGAVLPGTQETATPKRERIRLSALRRQPRG